MLDGVLNMSLIILGKYWKWTKKRKLNHKNEITLNTMSFFHFYFDFVNTDYCQYIRMAVKMKKKSSYSFVE